MVQQEEAIADLRIDLLAVRKPMERAQFIEPEVQNLGYPTRLNCVVAWECRPCFLGPVPRRVSVRQPREAQGRSKSDRVRLNDVI